MKFGVNTFIWSEGFDRSNLPLLPRVKTWGFDGEDGWTTAFALLPLCPVVAIAVLTPLVRAERTPAAARA